MNAIQTFEDVGFDSFAEKWSEYNLYTGQQVNVIRGSETISGIDSGVDQQGNLVVANRDGPGSTQFGRSQCEAGRQNMKWIFYSLLLANLAYMALNLSGASDIPGGRVRQ